VSRCETNTCLRDPITVRSTLSGLSICYYCSFGAFWIIFYPSSHYKALLFYLIISPVPTCLVHNCKISQRFAIPICYHPCLKIKFPLIPISGRCQDSITFLSGSLSVILKIQTDETQLKINKKGNSFFF